MMSNSVLAPMELGSLKHFFGHSDRHKESKAPPPLSDTQISLLDVFGEKFVVYNHIRHSICIGSFKQLLKLRPPQDLSVEEELPLSINAGLQFNQLSLLPDAEYCCVLWGRRAVAVVHFEQQKGESSHHITKEFIIEEKVYKEHPALTVFQCKWSLIPEIKILLVLNSDSFMRIYHYESGDSIGCFNFGSTHSLPFASTFSAEINPETPVDFDFGPYLATPQSWMVVVLKPTGQVFCALLGVTGFSCFLNYYIELKYHEEQEAQQEDFSGILCSNKFPIFIATSQDSGHISHSILLPTLVNKDSEDITDGNIVNGSYELFLKERVTLPVANINFNTIQLTKDPMFSNRYLYTHGSGIHLIATKFASEVQTFLEGNEDKLELSPSICKHLVNWSIGLSATGVKKSLGVSYIMNSQPPSLLCVLHDARTVKYNIPHPTAFFQLFDKGNAVPDSFDSVEGRNVFEAIGNMLKQSSEQPFYCSEQNLGKAESRKLLDVTLKTKYKQLEDLEKALESLSSYINSLILKTKEMTVSTQKLLDIRAEMKDKAQQLAEAYEEWEEQDQVIQKRMDIIMYRFHQTFSVLTDKEKEWQTKLRDITKDSVTIKLAVNGLRSAAAEQKDASNVQLVKLKQPQLEEIRCEIANQQNIITSLKVNIIQLLEKILPC